uniref:CSON013641 protein n=1 Tax=Culicoides sonorensis TaxID=179676 RepID=A0A336LM00_CULSO
MKILFSFILFLFGCVIARPGKDDEGRIVGGTTATPHEFPYIVSLQWSNGQHFCGGSIIHRSWVITAAHCEERPNNLRVVAGAHDVERLNGREQIRRSTAFIIHQNYDGGVGPNDIALVKVAQPFQFNLMVRAINLPQPRTYPTGWGLASGWGDMSRDASGNYARFLQKVWLPIHSQDKCLELWRGANIDRSNLCAAPLDGSTDTCNADSGGPLAQGNSLVGLVSWGPTPCARPNAPGGTYFIVVTIFLKLSTFFKKYLYGFHISWIGLLKHSEIIKLNDKRC